MMGQLSRLVAGIKLAKSSWLSEYSGGSGGGGGGGGSGRGGGGGGGGGEGGRYSFCL